MTVTAAEARAQGDISRTTRNHKQVRYARCVPGSTHCVAGDKGGIGLSRCRAKGEVTSPIGVARSRRSRFGARLHIVAGLGTGVFWAVSLVHFRIILRRGADCTEAACSVWCWCFCCHGFTSEGTVAAKRERDVTSCAPASLSSTSFSFCPRPLNLRPVPLQGVFSSVSSC